MSTTLNPYIVAIVALSIPLGFAFVGCCMRLMRWTIGSGRSAFKWLDFWLGTTERLVAMALFAWKPDQLPWFIGAWVGLKFAANWKRQTSDPRRRRSKDEPDEVFQGSLLSLIGNVLSFSFALATVCVTRWFSGQQ